MTGAATRRRIEGPRPVGKTVTARIADGEDNLTEASTVGLLTAAYALTHRIDAAKRGAVEMAGTARAGYYRTQETELRAQRDRITAEVLRRTGDA